MGGIKLEYLGPAVHGSYGNLTPEPAQSAKVCTARAGDQVRIFNLYAESYVTAQTAPITGAVTAAGQIAWEGPYLRITPLQEPSNPFHVSGTVVGTTQRDQPTARGGAGGGFVIPASTAGGMVFNAQSEGSQAYTPYPYYEIDANNGCAVTLPFDAELTLVTYMAGLWLYDFKQTTMRNADLAPLIAASEDHFQTRNFGADSAGASILRHIQVPTGAVDMRFFNPLFNNADLFLTPYFTDSNDSAKLAGAGINCTYFGWPTTTMNQEPIPCSGIRSIRITRQGAGGRPVGLQFRIKLR